MSRDSPSVDGANLPVWFLVVRAIISALLGALLIIGAAFDETPRPFIVAGGLVLLGLPIADLAFWRRP